jgi:hypothetical protein
LFSAVGILTVSKVSSKDMMLKSSENARSLGRVSSCADFSSSSSFSSSCKTTIGGECAGVDDGENMFWLEPERGGVGCLERMGMGRLACGKFGRRAGFFGEKSASSKLRPGPMALREDIQRFCLPGVPAVEASGVTAVLNEGNARGF